MARVPADLPFDRAGPMLFARGGDRETLRLGVAIERQRVAELTPEEIASAVARIDTHELHADEAMFAGKRAAEGMANIVRALALLSFTPGGVTFMGLHWCPDHAACEQAAREAGAL